MGSEMCIRDRSEFEGTPPKVLEIDRTPDATDPRLVHTTSLMMEAHGFVREEDGVGEMVGIADHLDYYGYRSKFVIHDEEARSKVGRGLVLAGAAFAKHFGERDVEFNEMLQLQRKLWPDGTPSIPQCWDASSNLGNSCHTDLDAWRSYAVWLSLKPGTSNSWWMLYPHHGVAVALTHGTWISWDGRVHPHCTAVPRVADGDELLSLFASLPQNLCAHLERNQACAAVIADRMLCGRKGGGAEELISRHLRPKCKVMMRWVPPAPDSLSHTGKRRWGQKHFRWVRCVVTDVDEVSGSVEVREFGSPYWVHPRLSPQDVWNRLVIGHL